MKKEFEFSNDEWEIDGFVLCGSAKLTITIEYSCGYYYFSLYQAKPFDVWLNGFMNYWVEKNQEFLRQYFFDHVLQAT